MALTAMEGVEVKVRASVRMEMKMKMKLCMKDGERVRRKTQGAVSKQ